MNIHFVLTEPQVPENIGAAARAIKTMGYQSLWLVNTREHLNPKAKYLAHGARDILTRARLFDNYDDMLTELDFAVGTTSKMRNVRYEYQPAGQLKDLLHSRSGIVQNAGIIFGREEYGLKNEELKKCHLVSYIPMNTSYPSLNLGQSVMLYAYLLSGLSGKQNKEKEQVNPAELDALTQKVITILTWLNLGETTNIHGRIMERMMQVESDDVHLLHSICNEIIKRMD